MSVTTLYDRAKKLDWETLPDLSRDIDAELEKCKAQLADISKKRVTPDDDLAILGLRRRLTMLTEASTHMTKAKDAMMEVKDCLSWDPDMSPWGETGAIDDLLSTDHE